MAKISTKKPDEDDPIVGNFVFSPEDTPKWMLVDLPNDKHKAYVAVDSTGTAEMQTGWGSLQPMREYLANLTYENEARLRYKKRSEREEEIFDAIQIRFAGSPVWWIDLDEGPRQAVTLLDLIEFGSDPRLFVRGPDERKHLYMMTLEQWDSASYPPESQGGPPYVKGVSVGREAGEAVQRQKKEYALAPINTPEWLHIDDDSGAFHIDNIEIDTSGTADMESPSTYHPSLEAWLKSALNRGSATHRDIYDQVKPRRRGGKPYWREAADILQAIAVLHEGSPVWWIDLDDGPVQAATLWDLAVFKQPRQWGKTDEKGEIISGAREMWLMSLDQWDSASYPPESLGGPPFVKGVSVARETSAAESSSALICMGREVEVDLKNNKTVSAPKRHGMLYDVDGVWWPACSLLITEFDQGRSVSTDSNGKAYFGRKTKVIEGHVDLPPKDLSKWKRLGEVTDIFYDRAGDKAPGFFRHEFHKPRGLWHLWFLFSSAADKPVILYKYGANTLRLELPEGCIVGDQGIALP